MKLATTDTEFNMLELATAKRGELVRVPMVALRHLLADHCTLLAAATGPVSRGGKGHSIERGPDQASLP